jgi:hypothetical protein
VVTRVNSAAGDADPATASIAVTAGNLLIAIVTERSGGAASSHVVTDDDLNTWTARIARTTEQADANFRRTFSVWTAIASVTGTLIVSADDGTANSKRVQVEQFELDVGETEFTFLEKAEADGGTGSASPQTSGTTAAVSGVNFFVYASAIWRNQSNDPWTFAGSPSWSNSLSTVVSNSGGTSGRSTASAYKNDTTAGTYESAVTFDGGDGHECSAGIMVFRTAAAGGGGTTSNVRRSG